MPRPRIPERRERLLAAARALALEQGWPATTVADVASRVGIGKGAVYLEFENKAAILDALITEGMKALSAAVQRRVLEDVRVVDLPAIYGFAVDALLSDPLMRAFYLDDADVLGGHVRAVSDGRYRQRFDWLGEYITHLQHAGVIDPQVDVRALAQMFSVFTIGLLHAPGTLEATTDDELRQTIALFAQFVGQGLAADRSNDSEAARLAQLTMLDRLATQLEGLQPHYPEEN